MYIDRSVDKFSRLIAEIGDYLWKECSENCFKRKLCLFAERKSWKAVIKSTEYLQYVKKGGEWGERETKRERESERKTGESSQPRKLIKAYN